MDIDVRQLRLVAELKSTGSATAAADRLGVTQSAVSHQLRELEGRLGCPVCSRVGKRLVLTAAGHRLLRAAETILPELDRAAADVGRMRDGHAGIVRVCAQCHTGYQWLPPLLGAFHARHPDVEVELAVQHTSHPLKALVDGALDVALVTDEVDDRRLKVQPLLTDEHVAVVAPGHPWARARFVTPDELGRETLLLYSSSPADSFTVRRILNPAGVRPARIRFVQLTEAIVEMVKANLGVSVLPKWAVQSALSRGDVRAVRITATGVHRQWSAVTLADASPPPYLEAFLQLLPTAIGGLAQAGGRPTQRTRAAGRTRAARTRRRA